jgi:hypothetical protein
MEHTNMRLVAEGCEPLHATHQDGVTYSYWEPTELDRQRIAQGGHVRLCVVGVSHPPVMLDTED